ncbi:hypothetical protein RJ640_017247 [Escallonia rubra]|uniref:Uncharacterized protein n=1 Tax=Escallonia rubra TaxID=112253 RepID=A0AA88UJN5_9ASTE|nr:hypothetical protein RJ640_017247 [Escallonia rubra]
MDKSLHLRCLDIIKSPLDEFKSFVIPDPNTVLSMVGSIRGAQDFLGSLDGSIVDNSKTFSGSVQDDPRPRTQASSKLGTYELINYISYNKVTLPPYGLDPVTRVYGLIDIAPDRSAIAILFLIAGHRTNWAIGDQGLKYILERDTPVRWHNRIVVIDVEDIVAVISTAYLLLMMVMMSLLLVTAAYSDRCALNCLLAGDFRVAR